MHHQIWMKTMSSPLSAAADKDFPSSSHWRIFNHPWKVWWGETVGGGQGRSLALTFTSIQADLHLRSAAGEGDEGRKGRSGCVGARAAGAATSWLREMRSRRERLADSEEEEEEVQGRRRRSGRTRPWIDAAKAWKSVRSPWSCVDAPPPVIAARGCGRAALRQPRRRFPPEDCTSPKMSSQAKVKKDKEIIAEYETQVKGWWDAGPRVETPLRNFVTSSRSQWNCTVLTFCYYFFTQLLCFCFIYWLQTVTWQNQFACSCMCGHANLTFASSRSSGSFLEFFLQHVNKRLLEIKED